MTGDEEVIAKLAETKLSFNVLRPVAESQEEFPALYNIMWGTKWDRYDYTERQRGVRGLRVNFTTAWSPPIPLFTYLLTQNPSLWIKLEWKDEDISAGIWVGYWKKDGMCVKQLHWRDLCMEDEYYSFMKPEEAECLQGRSQSVSESS